MLQQAHDGGSVQVNDDNWLSEEEAADEVGAEEAAALRRAMGDYLEGAWAELNVKQP